MQILTNIPMPPNLELGRGRPPKWPYDKLQVGESFFATNISMLSLKSSASKAGTKLKCSFRVRPWEMDGVSGYMVWRIK